MKKLKILVTGKNRRIATDVCNHLAEDKDYHVIKCSAKQDVLFATVPQERPRVIIICLGDETKETIKAFDILKECAKLGAITLIVILFTHLFSFIFHFILFRSQRFPHTDSSPG